MKTLFSSWNAEDGWLDGWTDTKMLSGMCWPYPEWESYIYTLRDNDDDKKILFMRSQHILPTGTKVGLSVRLSLVGQ